MTQHWPSLSYHEKVAIIILCPEVCFICLEELLSMDGIVFSGSGGTRRGNCIVERVPVFTKAFYTLKPKLRMQAR